MLCSVTPVLYAAPAPAAPSSRRALLEKNTSADPSTSAKKGSEAAHMQALQFPRGESHKEVPTGMPMGFSPLYSVQPFGAA